jgi:ribokinase
MNYDLILKIPRFAEVGETLTAEDALFSAGGKGANQAVQAAKLGIPVYMVGCVGEDANGEQLLAEAKNYGVHVEYVRKCDCPTGMGIVNACPDGSVRSVIIRGANYAITEADIDNLNELFQETALVILQMEIPMKINEYAIEKAKEAGCRILLNAAPAMQMELKYLAMTDILVVNEVEASYYLGCRIDTSESAMKGSVSLSEWLGNDCIITLGKEGSVVCTGGVPQFIPAKKVQAVESTGAGDSFIGAVGYALLNKMDLVEAGVFATCCSAVTVCGYGAQPSMPYLEEIEFGK